MRSFYGGGSVVKAVTSPLKKILKPVKSFLDPDIEKPVGADQTPTQAIAEDEQRTVVAQEEERRKSRAKLQAQEAGGRSSTLLTSLAPSRGIASQKPSLLG